MNEQTEKWNKKLFVYLYGHLPTETDAAISMMCKQIGQISKDTGLKFVTEFKCGDDLTGTSLSWITEIEVE